MPTLEKNTVYNIIIPRTKKEIQDDQKISKNLSYSIYIKK